MVMAVFFAIFAVGTLYLVIGTAEAVFLREKLQDSADAAALSGAVMHARAMNLLVLINIVMAALLAILVTLKLVETLAILGIIVAAALAWFTGGSSLSAIPPLKTVQGNVHEAYENLKDPIYNALKTLHQVSDTVQQVAPGVALAAVTLEIQEQAKGMQGFAVPPRLDTLDLPVTDGSFDKLCGEAGALPANLAKQALGDIPPVASLMGELEGPMKSLASEFSEWFCGESDGGADKPSQTQDVKRTYPQVASADKSLCEGTEPAKMDPARLREVEDACLRSKTDEEEGKPDSDTGACRRNTDCGNDGPYAERARLAREQCDPAKTPAPYAYWYQRREAHVSYEWNGKRWIRGEPVYTSSVRVGGDDGVWAAPCGKNGEVARGYRKVRTTSDEPGQILPVCSTEEAPFLPPEHGVAGTTSETRFTEVTEILGCRKVIREPIPVETGDQAESGGDKVPKELLSDATLGDENFQIRALMVGQPDVGEARRIVQITNFGHDKLENSVEKLSGLTGMAVAQAEYFYDGSDGRGAWMWNMSWRARLRRFSLPKSSTLDDLRKGCTLAGDLCGTAFGTILKHSDLFQH